MNGYLWQVEVEMPFDHAMSKNRAWRHGNGRTWVDSTHAAFRDGLVTLVKVEVNRAGVTVVQNRLWLDIHVTKPSMRGDPVNVLDMACDAVKVAVGLDDCWFSVERLDWDIGPEPKLTVAIGQKSATAIACCSTCGLRAATEFNKGRSRCRDCEKRSRK